VNVNELKAERHDHVQAAEKLVDAARKSGKDLSGVELAEYNGMVARIREIDSLVAKSEAFSKSTGGIIPSVPVVTMPGATKESGWVDPKTGNPVAVLTPEQRMSDLVVPALYDEPLSFGAYLRGIVTGKWTGAEREMKAMNEGTLGSGGYLLPSPLSTQIIDKVRNAAVMFKAGALTIPMETQTLGIARIAGDVTPMWHTEAATITASDMSFERVVFTAQTLAAICSMSVELFEDASNLDVIVSDAIAKVLAIELDRACLRGSGTAPELKGIRNQTSVVVDNTTFTTNGSAISTTTPTGAVAWDWLSKQVSGMWGVNENPNAAIYSARTAGELDLLRASTGEVLPPPGSVSKLQLLFTNSIPNNLTQGSNTDCSEAYVGDFSKALIGMRTGLVLEISRYANVGSTSLFSTMQVGIRAYLRADFQVARPAAFRVVTGIR
jgi:HK97 family phage major capsid protein